MKRKKIVGIAAVAVAALVALAGCSTNADPGAGSSAPVAPGTSSAAPTSAGSSAPVTDGSSSAPSTDGSSSSPSTDGSSSSPSSDGSSSNAPSGSGGADTTTVALPKKDKYVIGYSQANNAEPYRAQLNTQLEYFAKQQPNLELLPIADAQQDSSRQVSQVQQFIQQKVDILIVSPNESDPLTPPIEQACAAGIPVIVLDRTVNTDCIAAFIGGDNVAIGKAAGELAVKLLPDGGNVAELRGILSNQPQIDRDKGFRDAIAANPKIKIVKEQEAKWLKEEGTKVMQQWLQSGDKIDLVYAHNDPMALGAYLAAAAANKQADIKFIGIDGLAIPDGGIRAVQQGQLAGTFVYPTGAKEAVDTIEQMIGGEPFSQKQVLPTTAVTTDNADAVYQQYDFSQK